MMLVLKRTGRLKKQFYYYKGMTRSLPMAAGLQAGGSILHVCTYVQRCILWSPLQLYWLDHNTLSKFKGLRDFHKCGVYLYIFSLLCFADRSASILRRVLLHGHVQPNRLPGAGAARQDRDVQSPELHQRDKRPPVQVHLHVALQVA